MGETCSIGLAPTVVLVCRFRRLAMKHHPDIESAETSQQEFARICEAYEVLSSGESAVLGADTAVERPMQQPVTWQAVLYSQRW